MLLCPAVCPENIIGSLGDVEIVWQGREPAVVSESNLTAKDLEGAGA